MEKWLSLHKHGEAHAENLCSELSQTEHFSGAAEIFRQLGDITRVRIFWLLCHQEECVFNIAAMLEMSSPAVSHHLRLLSDCGLIISRRDGKEVYYKAADTEESRLLHLVVEQVMEITCPEKTSALYGSRQQIIHSVHEYLLEHLSERITIEGLSKRFLMNPTSLKQAFKEEYGASIAVHMKEHRMKQAAKLLRESEESVATIAAAVGYESQSRFTTAFKESFGCLPSEYRKGVL